MKQLRWLCLILALCMALTACSASKTSSEAAAGSSDDVSSGSDTAAEYTEAESVPATEPTGDPEESLRTSAAFTERFPICNETILGAIYNAPFTAGEPAPTEVWTEGTYDRLMLIPRYVGTTVRAYACSYDVEGWLTIADDPSFETISQDGCIIAASLARPEGGTAWYVSMELPDGSTSGMELQYDGRYGTPRFEFLQDPYRSTLIETPTAMEDWNPQFEMLGYERFWGFWRAATRAGLDPWDACRTYFSALTELGDCAAYTAMEDGETENGVCTLRAGCLHMSYAPEDGTLAERLAAQNTLYGQIGNERGILGPEQEDTGEPLYFRLTGLTVFNPSLAAAQVHVTVNGEDCGTFELTQGDFITLLPLDLPELAGDRPVEIRVEIQQTNYGSATEAIIEVWPGLESNISSAL